jgi:hypothetical protein
MSRPSLALSVLLLAGAARASVLDQHNDTGITGGTSIGVVGSAVDQSAAQTIQAGISGTLDRVELYFYADGALSSPLVLDIVPVAPGGLPDSSTILASASITPPPSGLQWVSFDLSSAALPVAAGQALALVIHSAQHLDQGQYAVEGTADQYAQGASYVRSFSGPWSPLSNYDLMFRTYVTPAAGSCYPNCDGSTSPPILNVADFGCFLTRFASADPYTNCDHSTQPPTLNVQDFTCFLTKFAAGCP